MSVKLGLSSHRFRAFVKNVLKMFGTKADVATELKRIRL